MATAAAMMLFDPIRSGFKNEINYVHHLKSKPMTLDRLKNLPSALGAFGRGFVETAKTTGNRGLMPLIPYHARHTRLNARAYMYGRVGIVVG